MPGHEKIQCYLKYSVLTCMSAILKTDIIFDVVVNEEVAMTFNTSVT